MPMEERRNHRFAFGWVVALLFTLGGFITLSTARSYSMSLLSASFFYGVVLLGPFAAFVHCHL